MAQLTVRISGTQQLQTTLDEKTFLEISRILNGDYMIQRGRPDEKLALSGENSVQSHIRNADSFIFFGTPTIGELFKLVSLFVGVQTKDHDLLAERNGINFMKPIIIYNPDFNKNDLEAGTDPKKIKNNYTLLVRVLHDLHRAGTIGQQVDNIIKIATNPDELLEMLIAENLPAKASAHLFDSGRKLDLPKAWLKPGAEITQHYRPDKNRLGVCAYTSASSKQDDISNHEAYQLGRFIAGLKHPSAELITGMGNTGLMSQVHKGCVENGGFSSGANCPHITVIEGVPAGFSRFWVRENIYERMEVMFDHSDIIIIGGGGRGGAGTIHEFLGGLLLWRLGSDKFKPNPKHIKLSGVPPIIVDNRLGMFSSAIALAENLNAKFQVANGTAEVTHKIRDILREERKNGHSHTKNEEARRQQRAASGQVRN